MLLGKYLLNTCISRSRFSEVYAGVQLTTSQPVVVKVLHTTRLPDSMREEMDGRFQRELEIYSELNHPNLVRLIDQGVLQHALFMVLEYIEGESLQSILTQGGRLDVFEAKHLMLQCLDALACGHRAGIVHRDFKPSNIMVSDTGLRRNAIILDFGIAGLAEGKSARRITRPGFIPGTVSYIAPEQVRGQITPASDIYAWGLVFLECLTGSRQRCLPEGNDLVSMLNQDTTMPPSLERHALGSILKRATARNLEERYQVIEQLFHDLVRCSVSDLHLHPRARQRTPSDQTVPALNARDLPAFRIEDIANEAEPPEESAIAEPVITSLHAAYIEACRARGCAEVDFGRFSRYLSHNANAWRKLLDCQTVNYHLCVDDGVVKLKPEPEFD